MNFIEELTWRGMIHQMMPGTEEQLKKEMASTPLPTVSISAICAE